MYLYDWITLLCTWNTVSHLYFNKIYINIIKKNAFILIIKQEKLITEHIYIKRCYGVEVWNRSCSPDIILQSILQEFVKIKSCFLYGQRLHKIKGRSLKGNITLKKKMLQCLCKYLVCEFEWWDFTISTLLANWAHCNIILDW